MFEFNTWVINHLIAGVKNHSFSKEWAAVMIGNYYVKGKLSDKDIERFEAETAEPEIEGVASDEILDDTSVNYELE